MTEKAALHGLLKKVHDLGMPLVLVVRVESGQIDVPEVKSRRSLMKAGKEKSI